MPNAVPASGGNGRAFLAAGSLDLESVGYVESEFVVSGSATSFTSAVPLGADGMWSVESASTADYRTRIIVRRPIDPAHFGGTVVVEWLNVSGGLDAAPDWTYLHVELIRSGAVWVGVSAQRVGIEGGPSMDIVAGLTLKAVDPARYSMLDHPGDEYSYDLFTQVGEAIRAADGVVLGGLEPRRVIAIGESQSAFRLTTYVNALGPLVDVWDGYLIHSRAGAGAPLYDGVDMPIEQHIRTDLAVPVLQFQSETDLVGPRLRFLGARQPDTAMVRTWEVAGTAHADVYNLSIGDTDTGDGRADLALFEAMMAPPSEFHGGLLSCPAPVNAGPHTYVLRAAFVALERWIDTGTPPPSRPVIDVADGDIVRDGRGIAVGGVRTPQVDVPVAVLSGLGQTGSVVCGLFGTTSVPGDLAVWAMPDGRAAFERDWIAALDGAVERGDILDADAVLLRAAVAHARIPS